ncbi:MAG TPA: FkbM family methyltransferase [Solirubrobacteraceae bacterium]|nr:FkbM family methyltransferase [Solirubrobacteraceae bacterium]
MNIDGLTLWYDSDRPSNTVRGLAAGAYEESIAHLFANTLDQGMVVVDVGAHIGYFTLVAAKLVGPSGHVWSFEPDPANRTSLEYNLEVNEMVDRVSVVPLAVTSTIGRRAFYRMRNDTGSSTLYPSTEGNGQRITVATTSLDTWADTEGWPRIDLVKIDAEGAEAAVLDGMTELIKRNPHVVVVLEFQADALQSAGEEPIEFLRRLLKMASGQVNLLDDGGSRITDQGNNLARLVRRSRWSPLNLTMRKTTTPSDPSS